jgi:transposase
MDLSLYHAEICAVAGSPGRDHTAPQLLISLWLYAYSQGISSARELARRCEFEPGFQWLCGLNPISHRTLSGFRSDYKAALDNLFVQVLGMLSAEGLISMQRVTLDGTKIKANASGNTFRREEKLKAHLALAQEQVEASAWRDDDTTPKRFSTLSDPSSPRPRFLSACRPAWRSAWKPSSASSWMAMPWSSANWKRNWTICAYVACHISEDMCGCRLYCLRA